MNELPEFLKKEPYEHMCREHEAENKAGKFRAGCFPCFEWASIEYGLVRGWELTQERIKQFKKEVEKQPNIKITHTFIEGLLDEVFK